MNMKRITITIPEDLLKKIENLKGTNTSFKICEILNNHFEYQLSESDKRIEKINEDVTLIKSLLLNQTQRNHTQKILEIKESNNKKWFQFWK